MARSPRLSYLPAMFATCMLFQTLYVACVLLWIVAPQLAGHRMLTAIFPDFQLLDWGNFFYGFIASAVYGWVISAIFVFFYNLWPALAAIVTEKSTGSSLRAQ